MGQLGVACHSPVTAGPGILNCAGEEPSFARRANMADAAASPVAIPSVLAWPSGICASELASAVLRVDALFGKKTLSTSYAASTAAASGDAPGGAVMVPK